MLWVWIILQKTKVTDPIAHKRIRNKGEYPLYNAKNTHEAIIDMDTFNKVQALYKKRHDLGSGHQRTANTTVFYQKIKCGYCGCNYVHGRSKCKNGYVNEYYYCGYKQRKLPKCGNCQISRDTLEFCIKRAYDLDEFDEDFFVEKVKRVIVEKDKPLIIEQWRNLIC